MWPRKTIGHGKIHWPWEKSNVVLKISGNHYLDYIIIFMAIVTNKSTVARTVMCRQDGRGRFPVLLDDHSKWRTNSQRKSQLS